MVAGPGYRIRNSCVCLRRVGVVSVAPMGHPKAIWPLASRRDLPMRNTNRKQMWKFLMRAMKKGPACQIEVASQYTKRFPDHATGWMVLADGLSVTARYGEAQVALRSCALQEIECSDVSQ